MGDDGHDIQDQVTRREANPTVRVQGQDRPPASFDGVDFQGLYAEINHADAVTLPDRELRNQIDALRARMQQAPARRVRPGGANTSIAEMQTPAVQATASWADGEDFAKRHGFKDGDFFLGRSVETGDALGDDDEAHVFMACKSRAGKGTGVIVPNHLLWEGPLVSNDPKGENATVAAARRGEGNDYAIGMGQSVRVLDPLLAADVEPQYRARFNPFEELDPANPECMPRSAVIAEALVVATGDEEIDYWAKDAMGMMHALILHIVSASYFQGRRSLGTLRDLIINGDQEAWKQAPEPEPDPATGKRPAKPDAMMMLFSLMMGNPAFNGEVAGAGRALFTMYKAGKGQWTGVHGGMRTFTDWLRDDRMRDQVSASDFKLAELKSRPEGMSLFISLPERNYVTYGGWQRCLLNLTAYELMETRAMPAVGKPVLMCLDEFAGLGKLPVFERGIAYFAGYRVKLFVVLQDFTSLQTIYENNWEAFLGNSSVKLFHDFGDITTAETMSKFLGEIELVRYAETQSAQAGMTRSLGMGRGRGTTESDSRQVGVGGSYGAGQSSSVTDGQGENWGDSETQNVQAGGGAGHTLNFERNKWLPSSLQEKLWLLQRNEQRGASVNHHASRGHGTSHNTGGNRQHSTSTGDSRHYGKNYSDSTGKTKGVSDNESINANRGDSLNLSMGLQEQLQTRALALPNELRQWLSQIKDPKHPYYPGLTLAIVGAEDPAIIRRINYFEDDFFDGFYDADPAYPESKPQRRARTAVMTITISPTGGLWDAGDTKDYPVLEGWFVAEGDGLARGLEIAAIRPAATTAGLSDVRIPLYSEATGMLTKIIMPAGSRLHPGVNEIAHYAFLVEDDRKERHCGSANRNLRAYDAREGASYEEYRKAWEEYREAWNAKQKREREAEEAREEEQVIRRIREERDRYADAWSDRIVHWYVISAVALGALVSVPILVIGMYKPNLLVLAAIAWIMIAFVYVCFSERNIPYLTELVRKTRTDRWYAQHPGQRNRFKKWEARQ